MDLASRRAKHIITVCPVSFRVSLAGFHGPLLDFMVYHSAGLHGPLAGLHGPPGPPGLHGPLAGLNAPLSRLHGPRTGLHVPLAAGFHGPPTGLHGPPSGPHDPPAGLMVRLLDFIDLSTVCVLPGQIPNPGYNQIL